VRFRNRCKSQLILHWRMWSQYWRY